MSNQIDADAQRIQQQQKQFIVELSDLVQELKKAFPKAELGNLQIRKGQRIIYGSSARGLRQELKGEDIKELSQLVKTPAKTAQIPGKIPSYQIKAGNEIILRQERSGRLSINKFAEAEKYLDRDRSDRDRDGLNYAEEVVKNTNPNRSDTDSDGKRDKEDLQPTRSETHTLNLIETQAEQVSVGQAFKELLKAVAREIKEKASQMIDRAKTWSAATQQYQADISLADTAVKLHSEYNAHQNLNYKSDSYNISRSGDTYSITDRDNNVLMRFKQTPFGKEVIENNLDRQTYQDFKFASKNLNKNRDLFKSQTEQIGNLGNLTPSDAIALDFESKARTVTEISNKFLHYLGTDKKELKSYKLSVGENNSLRIEAKDDRGVILEKVNGVTKINQLQNEDLIKFQNLDRRVELEVEKIREQKKARLAQRVANKEQQKTR